MLWTSTLRGGVEASGGLVGLGSQGQGRMTHPIAGGAIRLSCWAEFGRCSAVPVVTVLRCCLVYAGMHRDDVRPEIPHLERWPSPSSWQSEWSVPVFVRQAYLVACSLSLSFPEGQGKGEVERGYVACSGSRKERLSWTACPNV